MQINGKAVEGEVEPRKLLVDFIRDENVDLVINTPTGSPARSDGYEIRNAAVRGGVPCITTMAGLQAAVQGIADLLAAEQTVTSLQEFHA